MDLVSCYPVPLLGASANLARHYIAIFSKGEAGNARNPLLAGRVHVGGGGGGVGRG